MKSRSPRALLTAASIAVALAAADTYVVVLALTDMMSGVGLGVESIQRATPIISGFLLGYIAVLPLIGRLADVISRHKILLGCLVIFIIGSAITALATEMSVLVAGRLLQGIGGGGLVPATLALVADLWPVEKRGTPLGVVGAVQELGSVLGPLLGAVILAWQGWRAIFWVNVVLAALLWLVIRALGRGLDADAGTGRGGGLTEQRVGDRSPAWLRASAVVLGVIGGAVLVVALIAPPSLTTSVQWGGPFVAVDGSDSHIMTPIGFVGLALIALVVIVTAPRWWAVLRQVDLVGALLIAVALASLILTFASSNPEKEVVGPLGYALLPVGIIAALLYAVWHRRAANPLVPRGVLHRRGIIALVVSALVGAALVAVIVDVPLLARLAAPETMSDPETQAALVLVRFLVAVPVGAVLGGWLLHFVGPGLVAGPGLILAGAAMLLMHRWELHALDNAVSTTIILVLVGLGMGLALAPVNAAALADSPSDAHGSASALVVVARMVGMVVGLALLTAVGLHRYYQEAAKLTDPTNKDALLATGVVQVQTVFLGGAICALIGGVIAVALGSARMRSAEAPDAPAPRPAAHR